MAKKSYCGINNIARNIPNTGYCGVNNIARRLIKGYIGDSQGVARVFWDRSLWRWQSDLPYDFYKGAAVVYQDKIHILGGEDNPTGHYSWDGATWIQESVLPNNLVECCAIVFQNKIHTFGPTPGFPYRADHYSWDGTQWTQEPDVPYAFYGMNNVVIYNGDLYTISSWYGRSGQWSCVGKYDGTSFTIVSYSMPSSIHSVCVYDNLIYLLGNSGSAGGEYYTFDLSTVSSPSGAPYQFYNGFSIVYKGLIHLLGGENGKQLYHYAFNGQSAGSKVSDLPYPFARCPAVIYNGQIHIFGSPDADHRREHWAYGEKIYYFKAEHTIDAYIHAIWVQPIYLLTEKDFVMVDENANRKYVVAIPQGVYGIHVVETAREYFLLICDHRTTTTLKEYNATTGELVRTDTLYINQTSWKPSGKDYYYINTNVYWNTNSRDIETPLQPTVFESAWANNWGLWEIGYIVFDGVVTPM